MAYINQDDKNKLAPAIKAVLKKHGFKGTISIQHSSKLVVNIASGPLFQLLPCSRSYCQMSVPYFHGFEGKELEFLQELGNAMMTGNHDNSDLMTDYFDVGWYASINIGKWDKPYVCTAALAAA
jgi:hypothetical protein